MLGIGIVHGTHRLKAMVCDAALAVRGQYAIGYAFRWTYTGRPLRA